MMFIPGLRKEMRVLALLLIVYFMSLTWTVASSETDVTAAPVSTATKIAASSISPTKTKSAPTASTTTTLLVSTLTELPLKQTTPAPTSGRKFDGASFVGGIILGIVLTIIFVLLFKCWQSRNKSYHSL